MTAAAAWAAAEPALQRLFRTPYSDVRLLGAPALAAPLAPRGTAVHLANGAAAGVPFRRLGLRGWKAGIAAAQIESAALWPAMAVVDRFHPDRGAAPGRRSSRTRASSARRSPRTPSSASSSALLVRDER